MTVPLFMFTPVLLCLLRIKFCVAYLHTYAQSRVRNPRLLLSEIRPLCKIWQAQILVKWLCLWYIVVKDINVGGYEDVDDDFTLKVEQ